MNAQETTVLKAPKRNLWKDIKRHYSVYALLVIPVVYYAIFKYGPVINGQIAFKSFMPAQGVWGSVWIGFKNFTDFFSISDPCRFLSSGNISDYGLRRMHEKTAVRRILLSFSGAAVSLFLIYFS